MQRALRSKRFYAACNAEQVLILTVSLTRVFIGARLSRDSLKRLAGTFVARAKSTSNNSTEDSTPKRGRVILPLVALTPVWIFARCTCARALQETYTRIASSDSYERGQLLTNKPFSSTPVCPFFLFIRFFSQLHATITLHLLFDIQYLILSCIFLLIYCNLYV